MSLEQVASVPFAMCQSTAFACDMCICDDGAWNDQVGQCRNKAHLTFKVKLHTEISDMASCPTKAASSGLTIVKWWHAGRRGSAAIPTSAVRSAGELPLGGKVLPVNPNKSKAAAALFEIASHPSPLQRQPSAHATQALHASSARSAAPAHSEVNAHLQM